MKGDPLCLYLYFCLQVIIVACFLYLISPIATSEAFKYGLKNSLTLFRPQLNQRYLRNIEDDDQNEASFKDKYGMEERY